MELGYATTVHGAQGVTADTMHGLATGAESRQQLYTMLTRGRTANHLYLQVVGDGDPHSVIHPDTIRPRTPVDLLEQILARDDTPHSATTTQNDQRDPAVRLGEATARYLDALHAAAEDIAGPAVVDRLDTAADQLIPGLTGEPAWPALRAHLLLLAASGADPIAQLQAAAGVRELDTADDRAAVLDWRLDDTGLRNAGPGPLPWIPAIPHRLATDETWGPYLKTRAQLITERADQVRNAAAGRRPARLEDLGRIRPGPADRRCCGVAGGDAGQPRRPSTHRTPPTPKGRPHLAATPRPQPSPARAPPPCRNGDR